MNRAALAGMLAALLIGSAMAPAQALPSHPYPSQLPGTGGERLETGEIPAPAGNLLTYRIRLLPVASFPALPPLVALELRHLDCMIPQSFEAQQPENVIHGAFRAPGSDDWAALCSSAGSTTLYVFFDGEFESPITLRSQSDTTWLGAEPGSSLYGSAWGIATRPAAELRASPLLRRAAILDHDAIEDAHLEHSLTLHYHQTGRWITLIPLQ